ncbi:MAG: TerC family protein [Leptospiraceae bacterium]|nr:TerC family protein [Leptospiraceae bacterium]
MGIEFTSEAIIALLTLTVLEIVLGIDNIIFISILAGKLPPEQQAKARQIGLALAMIMRILLLLSLSWIMGLTKALFNVADFLSFLDASATWAEISGRDLILLGGGLFLLAKATMEIHGKLEGEEGHADAKVKGNFAGTLVQIMLLDIVFSLDSVITAVGMASQLWVMIAAVVIAVGVMMISATAVSNFVNEHPTVKILALSFLLLIGFSLVIESMEYHVPKGYIYFAMGFSVFVEVLNMQLRKRKGKPVHLHAPYTEE